ncbi:hypothetical protein [Synechocystis salina]|uniref:Uncharacterized protein n=1 Tax=Synechocystis salina LEGE 00031 TaxID=1828736 RepID=A0ABR9VWB0_9SYNC|nr:hypothetical protein [Synechocystis salina]MBE9242638.1 hypothetical protein [Synechocystis salina LEGE 00041]MBE9255647.1 hypothetical protein [Synechocystis salina LEGE 00031]
MIFNNTAEGNENGLTLSFWDIDNKMYYVFDEDKSSYSNYSGLMVRWFGNSIKVNHLIVGA